MLFHHREWLPILRHYDMWQETSYTRLIVARWRLLVASTASDRESSEDAVQACDCLRQGDSVVCILVLLVFRLCGLS